MRGFALAVAMMMTAALCGASPRYVIDMPQEPAVYEKTASEELLSYLKRLTTEGRVTVDGHEDVVFHVGDTAFAREKGLGASSLDDEEWVVRSFGRDVVLGGGGTRGTLFAVSHFLEDECGVRWYWRGEDDVPEGSVLTLKALDRRGKPFFARRQIYTGIEMSDRDAIHYRLNSKGRGSIPMAWGGGFVTGSPHHCHVWDRYIPWAKYGKDHPEWFSLRGANRVGGMSSGQLCLTNPEVVDLMEKCVRESIAKDRVRAEKDGTAAPRIYDLSMNDNDRYCQCPACEAETRIYGQSGLQLKFVNEIARRINADFPELRFQTLAYHYSEPAPTGGTRASDNVVVRLCNTRQNMAGDIRDPDGAFFRNQLESWKACAKNLHVWDYAQVNRPPQWGFPVASEFHIHSKFRTYAENNVTGLFLEHELPRGSDLFALKFHLHTHLMEDPFQDPAKLLKDFLDRYYGAAGETIIRARKRLDRIRRRENAFVWWYPTYNDFNFLTDGEAEEIARQFDLAERQVQGDPKREARVRTARTGIDRFLTFRRAFGTEVPPEAGVSGTPFFDFSVDKGEYAYDRHDRSDKLFTCVADADLGGRKVWRIMAEDAGYDLPFAFGVYDFRSQTQLAKARWEKPLGEGYHWYDLGEVDLTKWYIVHFTRQWTLDLPAGARGLENTRRRVKALIKFTGPKYFPGSTEPNAIYFARTVFCDLPKSAQ